MLKILTSLSFLYAFAIVIILLYGFIYYRDFKRSDYQHRRFPFIFFIISLACFSFLWINMHAPLKLRTFSNLDHHFIQHDGFDVIKKIELGKADTVNDVNNSYNRFLFSKHDNLVTISSAYSEDPLYIKGESGYQILSVNYPVAGHNVSFQCDGINFSISVADDNWFELKADDDVFKKEMPVKKGLSCWNIFRDEDGFINSVHYNKEKLVASLKNILFLRDDVSRTESGELKYFFSGRLFNYAKAVKYDKQQLLLNSQQFNSTLPDESSFAWGIGFLENNRNQFQVKYAGSDSFSLINRYPVAYPLSEEKRDDWSHHFVNKFLLSDVKDMHRIPAVFREGFLFPFFDVENTNNFPPILLSYQKNGKNGSLKIKAQLLNDKTKSIELQKDKLVLPAKSANFNWAFSIRNTYNWQFGDRVLSPATWQAFIFGSLGLFFLLVFLTSLTLPAGRQGWVWQLLSCILILLLTTRFFLYWRYKSFPPHEGMDLPSQQQLGGFSNFGTIIFAVILMALIFGFGFVKYSYGFVRKIIARLMNKSYHTNVENDKLFIDGFKNGFLNKIPFQNRFSKRTWFFVAWSLLLFTGGAVAGLNNFDAGVSRHLAIVLMIVYFFFLFISYKHSPLVATDKDSWWNIGTGNIFNIIINNPVKILLSVSLIGLFIFIDIGFAIVFLNYLIFNEAFLCINYGIAGLSAGSNKNAKFFGLLGISYLVFFVLNLFYAPYIFKFLLDMPQPMYVAGYAIFAAAITYMIVRLLPQYNTRKKIAIGFATAVALFGITFFFFPKERIVDKAAMTKYRIDVLTTPVDEAIAAAYEEGKTYRPVIRAAQNQWFINTFIDLENNPGVQSAGFHLLPHAPQNKGAKYNAQATDLVT
ncbi:MAG: hypothetical protein ACXWWC_13240, partial [Chitinophagaceae bacterium]